MATSDKEICGKCVKTVKISNLKSVQCTDFCKKWYHFSCSLLSNKKLHEIQNTADKKWSCLKCVRERSKLTRRSLTLNIDGLNPIDLNETGSSEAEDYTSESEVVSTKEITNTDLYKKICEVVSATSSLKKDVSEIKKCLQLFHDRICTLEEENISLKNSNDILEEQIIFLKDQVNNLAQDKLNNDIEINGVPVSENENLNVITSKLFSKLEININKSDTINMYRQQSKHNNSGLPSPIIITFRHNNIKNKIIEAKKDKTINFNEICTTTSSSTDSEINEKRLIYINERLTKNNNYLFKKARDLKRKNKVKFAWVKNGRVLIRKTESSRVIIFNNNTLNESNFD